MSRSRTKLHIRRGQRGEPSSESRSYLRLEERLDSQAANSDPEIIYECPNCGNPEVSNSDICSECGDVLDNGKSNFDFGWF